MFLRKNGTLEPSGYQAAKSLMTSWYKPNRCWTCANRLKACSFNIASSRPINGIRFFCQALILATTWVNSAGCVLLAFNAAFNKLDCWSVNAALKLGWSTAILSGFTTDSLAAMAAAATALTDKAAITIAKCFIFITFSLFNIFTLCTLKSLLLTIFSTCAQCCGWADDSASGRSNKLARSNWYCCLSLA